MPIDINRLRADRGGDVEAVRADQSKRFKAEDLVDSVLAVDSRWREATTAKNQLQQDLNRLQKEVIAVKKKEKEACDAEIAMAEDMRHQMKQVEVDLVSMEQERSIKLAQLGNTVDESVPVSKDEADNLVVSIWPSDPSCLSMLPCAVRKAEFPTPERKLLTHDQLLWRIGGYDPERGAKVAGSRGYFLQNVAVLLNQALLNYALAFLVKRGYSAIQPPYFMRKDTMAAVEIGGYDPERGAKVAGSRGYFLQNVAVLLNQALLNYALAFLVKRGYSAIQPPYFMRKDTMAAVENW
eukprot:CAMPEP_0178468136 /NCGR_PEP_ID=MMETSP0689_2-20121128/52765_1 /TAXON_ID=160604 /ORGANISM="Amphidinium massartii, Strain CS-259" /LENGTH=294 /DNA_ID=CAMNT_0020095185 /DNA_START=28 /DNA_END=910 /DNA_ORIENTATION=-